MKKRLKKNNKNKLEMIKKIIKSNPKRKVMIFQRKFKIIKIQKMKKKISQNLVLILMIETFFKKKIYIYIISLK